MELYSLETGNLMLDGGAMFGVVPKSIWNKVYPSDEKNLCNLSMRALLIIEDNRKILIDCGMGDKMDPKLAKHYFLNGEDTLQKSLQKINISPDEITDLVLSHLHFDHCGGAVINNNGLLELFFKNAFIWIGKEQWNSAMSPNRREKPSFLKENIKPLALSGKVKLISDNYFLTPNIDIRQFHGHTKGQLIPIINYNGKKLIYVADFIPTSAHIPISYVCGYDIEPLLTLQETEDFLNEAVENDYTFFFEHDITTECCSLEKTDKGVRMKEAFSLNDFIKQVQK